MTRIAKDQELILTISVRDKDTGEVIGGDIFSFTESDKKNFYSDCENMKVKKRLYSRMKRIVNKARWHLFEEIQKIILLDKDTQEK
jgi:hypothetical protein